MVWACGEIRSTPPACWRERNSRMQAAPMPPHSTEKDTGSFNSLNTKSSIEIDVLFKFRIFDVSNIICLAYYSKFIVKIIIQFNI